jgi:hypothetical protein
MDKNEALKYICDIPVIYNADGKISYHKLFKKALGLIEKMGIVKYDLVFYLKNNPQYIKIWDQYAQDKRGSESYYFGSENNVYSFGFKAKNSDEDVVFKVSKEPYELCADFILKDCEYISNL